MNETAIAINGDADAPPHAIDFEVNRPGVGIGDCDMRLLAVNLHLEPPTSGGDVQDFNRVSFRVGAESIGNVLRAPAVVAPTRWNARRQWPRAATALVGVECSSDRMEPIGGFVSRRAPRLGRQVLLDEMRVELAGLECGVFEHGDQKVTVGKGGCLGLSL